MSAQGGRAGLAADPFARFGAFVYRARWFVLVAWLIVLGVGGALAPKANGVLKAGSAEAITVTGVTQEIDTRRAAQTTRGGKRLRVSAPRMLYTLRLFPNRRMKQWPSSVRSP